MKEDSKDPSNEPPLPPVDGLRAWLVVLGSFCMHFVVLGNVYAVGLFIPVYEEEFQIGRAQASLVAQLQIGLLFGLGIISGRLGDRYGVSLIFGIGLVIYIIGLLLASFSVRFWQTVVTQGFMLGIGNGLMYWPGISIVPMWFEKRRAFATGIAVLGSGIGNFVIAIATNGLIRHGGYSFALQISALYCGILLIVAFIFLKRRLPTVKSHVLSDYVDLFKQRNFLIITISSMFFQVGFQVPFSHLPAYVEGLGFDSSFSSLAVGMIGVGSAVGRIILGFVADKFGQVRSFQGVLFCTSIVALVWYWCTTKGSIIAFAILYGFVSGGFIALIFPVLAVYYGVQKLGGIAGIVSIVLVPGCFLGPWFAGYSFDKSGSYDTSIFVTFGLLFASALILAFLGKPGNSNSPAPTSPDKDATETNSAEHSQDDSTSEKALP